MKKVPFFLLLSLCFWGQQAGTQPLTPANSLQPLQVGDPVPDLLLSPLIGHSTSQVRLSAFQQKLLLLDFWATWCTACLHHFPKLDSLQQQWGSQLQVLLVNAASTGDDRQKVAAFVEKRMHHKGKRYNLPVVAEDTVLSRLFPHKLLPHYVWIREGRVAAITSSEEVTSQNIQAVLEGRAVLKTKKDQLDFDRYKPLFVDGNGSQGAGLRYRSMLTGAIEGISSGTTVIRDSQNLIRRLLHTNATLLQLYRHAYSIYWPQNRVVLEMANPQAFAATDSLWCYELIAPAATRRQFNRRMQEDLSFYLGFTATVEKRPLSCLVLRQVGNTQKAISNKGPASHNLAVPGVPHFLHHQPLSRLVSHLNNLWDWPVLDESGFTHPVSLQLPANLLDRKAVEEALKTYGFELVPAQREIEVWVISENKKD